MYSIFSCFWISARWDFFLTTQPYPLLQICPVYTIHIPIVPNGKYPHSEVIFLYPYFQKSRFSEEKTVMKLSGLEFSSGALVLVVKVIQY